MRLLVPGRHHLLTNFQLQYLTLAVGNPAGLRDVDGQRIELSSQIDTIIWAVTSANHANTRRNPLPAHRRVAAIEAFAADLDADSFVYLIDDIGHSDHFAEYLLKTVEVESLGRFRLRPEDTLVATPTPEVITQYERLGFRVLPMELTDRNGPTWRARTPWQLLEDLAAAGEHWRTCPVFLTEVARASRRLFLKYQEGDRLLELHRQPLTDDGSLTRHRDYNIYARAFDEGAERKYALVKGLVQPGRIVDVGCGTGALLRQLTLDDRFRESDFYGVEIAHDLFALCQSRKQQGYFANDNVFFYPLNAAERPVFADNSVNTFLTFSLTHELESYQGRAKLEGFIRLLHRQLALGGRWLNVDVIGPESGDEEALMWLNNKDGRNDDWRTAFDPEHREQWRQYLGGLSTFGRFLRFAEDFRRDEGYRLEYTLEERGGETYSRLRLRDACEFLSKKDYLDNWTCEVHETFCYWSFPDWRRAVEAVGFRVLPGSSAFANGWIVENRYRGKVELFHERGGELEPMEYPVTTMVLAAEKR